VGSIACLKAAEKRKIFASEGIRKLKSLYMKYLKFNQRSSI
jgi:hypothetical protein